MACVWVYVAEHVLRCLCSPGYSHVEVCTRLHVCPWADGLARGEDTQGFITMRPLPVCVPMTEQARGPPGHVNGVRLCCGVCVSPRVWVATCAPTRVSAFPPRVCGYECGRPEASPRCSSRGVCGSVRSPSPECAFVVLGA